MSLAAFNPGMRAELARASAQAAAFSPASIAGTVLWLDPDDESTITRATPGDPTSAANSIADKGYLNTAWSGAGALSAQTFTNNDTSDINIQTISGVGNGKQFFYQLPTASAGGFDEFESTPSASPYNLTTGAGSGAIDADWVLWMVSYSGSGNTDFHQHLWLRGVRNNSPANAFELRSTFTATWVLGSEWASGSQAIIHTGAHFQNSLKFAALKSYDDGGTRKYSMCTDGVNWTTGVAVTSTAATPSASYNKWQLGFRYVSSDKAAAIGDAGFIAGTISADDLLSLHGYLDDKYGGLGA